MYKHFNKYGNIEITDNILRYRISLDYLGTDDEKKIENELKQKLIEVEKEIFITPIDIKVVNRYLVIYYNMEHLMSFDRLREFTLLENIPYFLSLVDLALEYEKGNIFSWERLNFVVDEFSKSVKVIFFETNTLKVYDKKVDIIKTVKDMIISSLTRQNTFLTLPKRHDFIDASEENVQFVERLYKLENLEDIQYFLETESLNLEQKEYSITDFQDEDINTNKKEKVIKLNPKKNKKTKKASQLNVNKVTKSNHSSKNNKVKRFDKNVITLFIAVGILFIVFIYSKFTSNEPTEPMIQYNEEISNTFTAKTNPLNNSESSQILEAYRLVYNSHIEEAYDLINTLPTNEISVDDVELIIDIYFRNNKAAEMLDKYPNLANNFITYLISKNEITNLPDYVEEMQTENPYIQFEVAYLKNNSEEVLLYKDQVQMNARRESQIVDAYINTGKYKEALEFARNTNNPDLITRAEKAGK